MLKLKRVVPEPTSGNLIRITSDDREYMQLEFEKLSGEDVLSTAKDRYRNVFGEGGKINAKADPLFTAVKNRLKQVNENGEFANGPKVLATIQTITTKPEYIPNEFGKNTHPETGEPCNISREYTGVVFEDETIEQVARRNGRELLDEKPATEEEVFAGQEEDMSITQG